MFSCPGGCVCLALPSLNRWSVLPKPCPKQFTVKSIHLGSCTIFTTTREEEIQTSRNPLKQPHVLISTVSPRLPWSALPQSQRRPPSGRWLRPFPARRPALRTAPREAGRGGPEAACTNGLRSFKSPTESNLAAGLPTYRKYSKVLSTGSLFLIFR
jgi:hypothetical protein